MKQIKIYALPGTMCNDQLWHKVRTYAKDSFELIHIPIPANKNFEQLTDWLNEYFEDDKINLLGFSLGGYIASYFAVKYPSRVGKLMVVGNSPCCLNEIEINQRTLLIKHINNGRYKGMTTQRAKYFLEYENDDDISLLKIMDAELGQNELLSQLTHTSSRKDLLLSIVNLSMNITFFYSAKDPLVNHTWISSLKSTCPNTIKTVVTDGNSHILPLEKPQELTEQINILLQ